MHNIGTIEVLGRRFDLKLGPRDQFFVELDGQAFSGNNRAHLAAVLSAHLKGKRKKVRMSCFEIVGGEVLPLMVTGIHAGNGNILYRHWDKRGCDWGPPQQALSGSDIFQALTQSDSEQLEQNLKIIADAQAVVDSLCKAIDKTELERELGIE